jgi:hypothetical protein
MMLTMQERISAIRHHPRHKSGFRLALGIVLQIAFWQASRLLDRGKFDAREIDCREFDLPLPRLAPAFDGLRLLHISDLHMGTWMNPERLAGIAALVNAQSADLIAITGDFVSYTVEQPLRELAASLSRLTPREGAFAVLGNHDIWTDPSAVRAMLAGAGITELPNRVHTLRRGSACLHLAGVDNTYEHLDDLPAVLAQIPAEGAAILLAHEPDYADRSAATGRFDLQLSGHSHGGQMNFPLAGPLFLPRYAHRYPRGLYRINGMQLYTNRGLGTTALQLRIRCPPEIAVIRLRAGAV